MIHLDLFSGIGGFAYAIDQVFDNVEHIFCEIDPFCQQVLKKHWKGSVIYGDIKELTLLPTYFNIEEKGGSNERNISRSGEPLQQGIINRGDSRFLQDNQTSNVENSKTSRGSIQEQSSLWPEKSFLPGNESKRQGAEYRGTRTKKRDIKTSTNLPELQGNRKLKRDRSASPGLFETIRDNVALSTLPSQMAQRAYSERVTLNERPFILTAGTPCQPASQAGKRGGKKDDRWLWPETFRIIREARPTWCILENVRGLLTLEHGVVFEELLAEMEGIGYDVQAFVIPAVAVNAPHRRDRVWIVALHTASDGCRGAKTPTDEKRYAKKSGQNRELEGGFEGPHSHAPDTSTSGFQRETCGKFKIVSREAETPERSKPCGTFATESWNKNWLEVATELCRMDDGLSCELDGFKLTKSRHRVERLKALGNSIVPQVAIEIFKAIKKGHEK